MASQRAPLQIKNLSSNDTVKFRLSCQLGNEIVDYPGIITFEVPKFPRLVSKSNGIVAKIIGQTNALERVEGAENETVNRYTFVINNRRGTRVLTLRVSSAEDIKKNGLIRINSNTATPVGLQALDNKVLEVTNIQRLGAGKPILISVNVPSNISLAQQVNTQTCTNMSITAYEKKTPSQTYSIEINDRGILKNLEYKWDYRHVAIFTYERRTANGVPSNKTMLNTNIVVTDDAPPAYSSLPAIYGCFASPRRVVQQLNKNDNVVKTLFHVAIAQYQLSLNGVWVGSWLQKDKDGKPIWKTVAPEVN